MLINKPTTVHEETESLQLPDEFEPLMVDEVHMLCPECKMIVVCRRTVYKSFTDYTCKNRKHHFTQVNEPGKKIPGDRVDREQDPEAGEDQAPRERRKRWWER